MTDKLGPTGDFPEGKLDKTDEGGLKIGIAFDSYTNVVRIDFGKEVAWIGMQPAQAMEFAKTIMKKAGAKKIEVEY